MRDAVFLHGYNEPTLLLLHEAEASWSGFACERKDTCALRLTCLVEHRT